MRTYLQKKYKNSVINFIKNGENSFSPDSKKYLIVKNISGKGTFVKKDLTHFAELGLAVQVNGSDYLEPLVGENKKYYRFSHEN
jgi:hypothetical protein